MTRVFSTRTALFIAMLANTPVLAQEAGHPDLSSGYQIAAISLATATPTVTAGLGGKVVEAKPAWHDMPLAAHGNSIWAFVHATAVQPAIDATSYAGAWIASSSDAAVTAAQNAGTTLNENAKVAVTAAYDMGQRIASSSKQAWNSATSTASTAVDRIGLVGDWSVDIVKEVENHLRGDGNGEFAVLIKESGFALANIRVGVGIIPGLTVEFKHERNLTPAELEAYLAHVAEYERKSKGPVAYFEGLLLRKLAKAGQYSGGMRISELHVDVFPLPGMDVYFDPFKYEEDQNKMLVEAFSSAGREEKTVKSIGDRIARLEEAVAALRNGK